MNTRPESSSNHKTNVASHSYFIIRASVCPCVRASVRPFVRASVFVCVRVCMCVRGRVYACFVRVTARMRAFAREPCADVHMFACLPSHVWD